MTLDTRPDFEQGTYLCNGHYLVHYMAVSVDPAVQMLAGGVDGRYRDDRFTDEKMSVEKVIPILDKMANYGKIEYSGLIIEPINSKTRTAIYWSTNTHEYLFGIDAEYHELIQHNNLSVCASAESENLCLLLQKGGLNVGVVMPMRCDAYDKLNRPNPFTKTLQTKEVA